MQDLRILSQFPKMISLDTIKVNDEFLHLVFNPPYGERLKY